MLAVMPGSGRSETTTSYVAGAARRSQRKASAVDDRGRRGSPYACALSAESAGSVRASRTTPGSSSTTVDRRDVRVAQHLAGGQPVAAAEDQDPRVRAGHRGVDERLVVAVLVAAADPQPPVEVEVEGARRAGPRR